MVEDTAHTINKKVGWLLHGQEAILVPDFNTKMPVSDSGEGSVFTGIHDPGGRSGRAAGDTTH